MESEDDLLEAARRLSELCGDAALLITRRSGGDDAVRQQTGGSRFQRRRGPCTTSPAAGDTVVAVLAVALGRGLPLADAGRLANTAAGIVVGKVGTSTVTLEELGERLA